jgi:hypothetical protein
VSVWAYLAVKGEYWGGVCSANANPKSIGKFMSEFVKAGFEITSVADRSEYNQKLDLLKPYNQSPEWQLKHARKPRRKQ